MRALKRRREGRPGRCGLAWQRGQPGCWLRALLSPCRQLANWQIQAFAIPRRPRAGRAGPARAGARRWINPSMPRSFSAKPSMSVPA